MTRPLYESAYDLAFEQMFCEKLVPWLNFRKVPRSYGFDFVGRDNNLPIIAELKNRKNYNMVDIPDGRLILSLLKYNVFRSYHDIGYKTFLYVAAKDGLWRIDGTDCVMFPNGAPELTFAGRRDRNDPADIEPCVLYETKNFKQLYTKDTLEKIDEYRKIQGIDKASD